MIVNKDVFDRLIGEAVDHDFFGWDFSYLSGRMLESPLSWDYRQLVLDKIKTADSLLDMDTGGGELLASFSPLPRQTYATESYPPNVPIARSRLEPLGVKVLDALATATLPFGDDSIDLVINRHGGYLASEVHRILKSGGSFITQQVGGKNNIGLNEMLQECVEFEHSDWSLDYATRQLEESGFAIVDQREEYPKAEFTDIGAVVYYLKVISWQVSDFTVEKYYNRLGKIHNIIEETGKFTVTSHRFYIEAQKK
jgi:SAM-dependent methyltransferase